MANSSESKHKSIKKNSHKKRKLSTSTDTQKPSKKPHFGEDSEDVQHDNVEERVLLEKMVAEREIYGGNHQWRSLELVLLIQNKGINTQTKVELIFDFVISKAFKTDNDEEQEFNALNISRSIVYISNWIQSLLITSEKKIRSKDNKSSKDAQFCLDYKCWQILKSCLEESSKLKAPLTLSRDLLRVISCVAKNTHENIGNDSFSTNECQLYDIVNDCLKLLFSSNGRSLNGNLDLWTFTVSSLLELVIETYTRDLQDSNVGNLIIDSSSLVLEQFSKFLKVHPCRKNGFRDFVENLLEPLLVLLGMLPKHIKEDDNSNLKVKKLFNFVQEVISYGLFHLVHLDEYLRLHGTEKYTSFSEWKLLNEKTLVKSYIRHLFEKLENLVSDKKVHSLSGIGEMFHLFVNYVKNHKGDPHKSESLSLIGAQTQKDPSKTGSLTSEKSKTTNSIFDFFVLSMEPLLLDLRKNLESEVDSRTFLMNTNFTLKSVNSIFSTMVRERIYVRTEDNSEGACLNFFKISYGLLISCYNKVSQLWNSNFDEPEVIHSLGKEFVFVIMNFLDIEYEVIGDDLVNTWLIILTILAMGYSSENVFQVCSSSSVCIDLGCRVVNLYSELRQVNNALFVICKGLRHLVFPEEDENKSSEVSPPDFSLHGDKFAKSALLLLRSQQFRLAVCNAIKSIPEGQASGYIQTLSDDISDSLEWMNLTCSIKDANFHHEASVKAEIFGMILSEIYSLILESIPMTTGNSYRTGVSLENLMGVLRPSLTLLTPLEEDGVDPFILSVFGKKCKKKLKSKASLLILFFFRLYVSCRSLYRQTLSLMPPKSTKKMSGMLVDLCTAYSGDYLLEMTDFKNEGYFSWVGQPSSSLLSIIRVLKDGIIQDGLDCDSCLIYVMHIMTLQRLGDLKRQIQCVEYTAQRSGNVISSKMLDDADVAVLRKKKRKQGKILKGLKDEAVALTGFIMEQLHVSMFDEKISKGVESWNFGVCAVDEKTINIAIWWILCQNIDIWCSYANKKSLKLFLSHLIENYLPNEEDRDYEGNTGVEMCVTRRKISHDLLCDTNFYDQRFVCRYIVSTICNALKKLAPSLFENSSNNNMKWGSCDCPEALNVLNNTPMATKGDCCINQASSQLNFNVAASQSLLNLLCRMMEKALDFKSFSSCLMYLVNFERLIIGSYMEPLQTLTLPDHLNLLKLLVTSRRTFKYILTTFCQKSEACNSSNLGIFSESPSPFLWLLKSMNLVVDRSKSISIAQDKVNTMIVSLMDQTSYIFFTISKHDFELAIDFALNPSKETEAYESLDMVLKALEAETKAVLPLLEEISNSGNVKIELNNLASILSCIQGFLWGLESALSETGVNYKEVKAKLMKLNYTTISRIIDFLDMIVKLIGLSSQIFEMDLLESFLVGENLETACLLRRLLISSSAITRLSMMFKCPSLSSTVIQTLTNYSDFLLTKFSQLSSVPNSSPFFWLDGTVQFLEAFPSTGPTSTKDMYTKLKAMGKCICLEGKRAKSASHDIESVTKLLTQNEVIESNLWDGFYGLSDLKSRLRKSFKVFIEKSNKSDLLCVMEVLQQVLTGIRVGSTMICDIEMGVVDGGVVSSVVAAGVDCLDVLLESLKGKQLNVVKSQVNSLTTSLFNIIAHLQGPTLFHNNPTNIPTTNNPDSGSVVLMCVEVIARIAGKPALFHLDSHHISQSLHIPETLFQCFGSLKEELGSGLVDRRFSINLYAACCRLLWTIVKHHKSACVRSIFFLQTSLQALLQCLEHVNTDTKDDNIYFAWEVEEAVKCASYLRRVYEEIRQQKEVFGEHSFKFLSDFICVLTGYSLLKYGLKREIDEALRPGVYALIDVCSFDDLQHLHTVFGDGPRRSTLASLKHDYEHNFKYGGKV